jgi:hypothetical protein
LSSTFLTSQAGNPVSRHHSTVAPAFSVTIAALDGLFTNQEWHGIDAVAGIESRGFILASALADRRGKGFVPIRKQGKLPPPVVDIAYDLEYGTGVLEMQAGSGRLVLIDDVLATGGTLTASAALSLAGRVLRARCRCADRHRHRARLHLRRSFATHRHAVRLTHDRTCDDGRSASCGTGIHLRHGRARHAGVGHDHSSAARAHRRLHGRRHGASRKNRRHLRLRLGADAVRLDADHGRSLDRFGDGR